MSTKFVQSLTLYQSGSGSIIGATMVNLTSLTDIYGNAITTMSAFGSVGYITLEPDTTNEEGAIFTGITVNTNGTVSLTGVSTILAQSPYTATSGLIRYHNGGSKVVITDNVAFWATFANLNNDQTFSGANTFSQKVAVGAVTSSDLGKAATVDFVNATAIAGAPNASTTVKGIVQEATQAQILAKTSSGSTGAELYVNPATLPSTLLSDYKVDTGAADAYAIAPAPAIAAYIAGQSFTFKAANSNLTTTPTLNVSGLGTKTIVKINGSTPLAAGDIVTGQIVQVEYDGTNFQMLSPAGNAPLTSANVKFGGNGSDGVLSITSGTTTINLGNAAVVTKNYTSISITGTGKLAFSNPNTNGTIVILKSQGNVVLTSATAPMIDASVMGAAGGAIATSSTGSVAGNSGSTGQGILFSDGGGGGGGTGPTGGIAGTIAVPAFIVQTVISKNWQVIPGAGGGSGAIIVAGGSVGTVKNSGIGGNGGGGLFIECAGALNFTTASGISVAGGGGGSGDAGVNAVVTNANGGGGGGAGGFCIILYNTLTANSGTITISGGTGGNVGSGNGLAGAGGGGGGGKTAGNAGTTSATSNAKTGGDGAAGFSLVVANTEYV